MNLIIRIILIVGLIPSISLKLLAQSDAYADHIGSEDGLISQLCQFLVEDDLGNLWISSFQDLQKYNGYTVTAFPLSNNSEDLYGVLLSLIHI